MKQFRDTNYLITENGEVFNKKRQVFIKPWIRSGYYYISLGAKNKFAIHRLVAEIYCEGFNLDLDVNHKDGNKLNNHYSNLEWCTRSQNCQHAYDNNLSKRRFGHSSTVGSKNSMSVLNEEKVTEIRRLYETNQFTYTDLGERYGVNQATIGYIIQRKTWKHIT